MVWQPWKLSLGIVIATTASVQAGAPRVNTKSTIPVPIHAGPQNRAGQSGQELTNSIGMKLRLIRAGNFLMGSSTTATHEPAEVPQHRVRIRRPFYLGQFEVTRGQFRIFVEET